MLIKDSDAAWTNVIPRNKAAFPRNRINILVCLEYVLIARAILSFPI